MSTLSHYFLYDIVFKISGKNNQITIGVFWVYSVSIVLRPLFIRNKWFVQLFLKH